MFQGHVSEWTWEFESPLRHQQIKIPVTVRLRVFLICSVLSRLEANGGEPTQGRHHAIDHMSVTVRWRIFIIAFLFVEELYSDGKYYVATLFRFFQCVDYVISSGNFTLGSYFTVDIFYSPNCREEKQRYLNML